MRIGLCSAVLATGVAALLVTLPASALAAPNRDVHLSESRVCEAADAIEKIHTLSDLAEIADGDFKLESAFLLVGFWGVNKILCGGAAQDAHDILLNGISSQSLAPLLSDLPALKLPAVVPKAPTVHIAFPTVAIGSVSRGNLDRTAVPLSIRWLQWGRGVSSTDLDVVQEDTGRVTPWPGIQIAARGLLHLTRSARFFPAGHSYRVCLTVWSNGASERACSRGFAVATADANVASLNIDLGVARNRLFAWPIPYLASQIAIVSPQGGVAHVGVDDQSPELAGCGFRGDCVSYVSPFLPYASHTLYVQRTGFTPLTADWLIYLRAD